MTDTPIPGIAEREWSPKWCTTATCPGHYGPSNGRTDAWACTFCATEITHIELTTADKFGDEFTTKDGILQRGIDPTTTYTYATSDRTWTLTVSELRENLRYSGASHWIERERILDTINTNGTVERITGFGIPTVITRNTP